MYWDDKIKDKEFEEIILKNVTAKEAKKKFPKVMIID